jgi:DNA-binding LytR/AlgR family response regulator
MPKKIFYVDDQEDTLSSVETIFYEKLNPSVIELELHVGSYLVVQAFMNKIEEQYTEQHCYVLDINMPTSRELKLTRGIWPQDHLGDSHFCGIALAKWLHTKKGVPQEHIVLLTHWVNFKETHQDVLSELEVDSVRWVAKHQIRRNLGHIFEEWRQL